MAWTETYALARVVAALAVQVEPAHWTQVLTAVSVAVLALLGVAVATGALVALRSVLRLTRTVERTVDRLGPRTEPLIERFGRLAEDAGRITGTVRRELEDVGETVEDANRNARALTRALERRVRRFAAVMDVVQDETERLLLDATATARGAHATAEALRRRRTRDGGEPQLGTPPGARRPEPPAAPGEPRDVSAEPDRPGDA